MTDVRRYCLITPCRDEAEFARVTLESVLRQTVQPALWLIVDDGSTDETPAILAEYEEKVDFIRVVRREDRGERRVGPGVIEAFYAGYDEIDPSNFDYLCKFDLDLDLPPAYFETLMKRMEADPRIGTCSGRAYKRVDGGLESEGGSAEMSEGMTKFYRTRCFQEIGGFVREVMWDGIDCHRCRMLGWKACSFDDDATRFIHLRPMGSSHKSIITGRMRHGFGQYFMGTGWLYMTASAIFRMKTRPLLVGGAAMWLGYARAALQHKPRYRDREFRRFLRRYQRAVLLKGRRRATEEFSRPR
jgi:glycosyltransferase involved in cell wall biosynthesis